MRPVLPGSKNQSNDHRVAKHECANRKVDGSILRQKSFGYGAYRPEWNRNNEDQGEENQRRPARPYTRIHLLDRHISSSSHGWSPFYRRASGMSRKALS